MNNTNQVQHGKEGLIRSFLTVVIGVLLLSYVGFDLRGRIVEFQQDYDQEISTVQAFIQGTLIPVGQDIFDASLDIARDNQLNRDTFGNFMQVLQGLKESLLNAK